MKHVPQISSRVPALPETGARDFNGLPVSLPKTDKPRPHICGECGRGFARLEHLKRHERSHTKEKPFECHECTRCFARRDLLLRHQQKLHSATTPASKPRGTRRESTSSGVTTGRVRKGSVAGGVNGPSPGALASMRPRANTISHLDNSTLGLITPIHLMPRGGAAASRYTGPMPLLSQHPGPVAGRGTGSATSHNGPSRTPMRLDTQGLNNVALGGGLRTAPILGSSLQRYPPESAFFGHPGFSASTIDPAQLHSPNPLHVQSFDRTASPFRHSFHSLGPAQALIEDESCYEWMRGVDPSVLRTAQQETAMYRSSPSNMSTGSQGAVSDSYMTDSAPMLNGSFPPLPWQQAPTSAPELRQQSLPFHYSHPGRAIGGFDATMVAEPMDLSSIASGLDSSFFYPPNGQFPPLSPTHILASQPLPQSFHLPMQLPQGTPSPSSNETLETRDEESRQSSVTSVSAKSMGDANRLAMTGMSIVQLSSYA